MKTTLLRSAAAWADAASAATRPPMPTPPFSSHDRPRIGVDCDGVLLSWRQGFPAFIDERLGLTLTPDDMRHSNMAHAPTFTEMGMQPSHVYGLVNEYCHTHEAPLEDPAAPGVIRELQESFDLFLETHRRPSSEPFTTSLLADYDIVFDEAHFVPNHHKNRGDVLIDDMERNLVLSGTRGLLFQQPWNLDAAATPDLRPVRGWRQVRDALFDWYPEVLCS